MTDPRIIALSSNPGQVEPGPFSEHELRQQWNAQADEFNQWESLDSSEQLAWAQTRAIAAAATASPELPKPEAERVLRLAEIIYKVGLDYDSKDIVFSAAALAEAIGSEVPPMPDINTPNLLPCPFCGGTELSIRTDLQSSIAYVVCSNCDAQGPLASFAEMLWEKEEAAAGWNQRSPWQPIETAPVDAVEILVLDGRKVKSVVSSGPDAGCFSNEFGDEESLVWFPTHWQPLYLPPTTTPSPHA